MLRFLLAVLAVLEIKGLLNPLRQHSFSRRQHQIFESTTILQASGTSQKPLYDGTNYTFPDTTTPAGIAELLEVSFVNACMQLSTGYVDVLKMFIAASMASYELGFSIEDVQKELLACPKQTANRPLMKEEENLRYTWYCLVYSTLATIGHPSRNPLIQESIPKDIQDMYRDAVEKVAAANKEGKSVPLEDLVKDLDPSLSQIEKAVRSQSLRVVALTTIVLSESMESREGMAPPTPPIEGAFG